MRANLKGIRILIVDDHTDTRDKLMQALTFCGASVRDARSAHDAVPLLPQADVVVTDLLLAEDDGIWLLAEARRLPPRLLAIALTG